MKLTEQRKKLLTHIAQSPRKAKHFSHKNVVVSLSPVLVEQYLKELAERGHLVEQDGTYSITMLGRQALDSSNIEEEPKRFVSKEKYKVGDGDFHIHMRAGSDHSHIKSRGV